MCDHSSGLPVAGQLERPTRAITRLSPRMERTTPSPLFGLSPGGVYHARDVTAPAVSSYLTISPLPGKPGGIFSVALSVAGSSPTRLPGITRSSALRCPDFPHSLAGRATMQCIPGPRKPGPGRLKIRKATGPTGPAGSPLPGGASKSVPERI